MSRIGRKHIAIPAGVEVKVNGHEVTVKGPKATLTQEFHHDMAIDHADQAHEGEVFLLSSHVVLADGQSQHTQSQSSHLGGAGRDQ